MKQTIISKFPWLVVDFTAKVRWRMRYDHNPLWVALTDKYAMREYAQAKGIPIPELYYVTDQPETIPFDDLPPRYMIKANHGCSWNIACIDGQHYDFRNGTQIVDDKGTFKDLSGASKHKLNQQEVIETCRHWLKSVYSYREWAYSQIEPKIIIEEWLEPKPNNILKDYKTHSFNGQPGAFGVVSPHSRNNSQKVYYSSEWEMFDSTDGLYGIPDPPPEKPEELDELIWIIQQAAEGIDYIRVDLYITAKGPMLGELTVYPAGGIPNNVTGSPELDKWLGDQWQFSKFQFLQAFWLNLTTRLKVVWRRNFRRVNIA